MDLMRHVVGQPFVLFSGLPVTYRSMPFNKLDHHIHGEIIPRFKLSTNLAPGEVFEAISEHMKSDHTIRGEVTSEYCILRVPTQEAHYWSPELQIKTYDDENHEGQTVLRCLIGPRQVVWAMFTFTYVTIGLISFFGGLYGLSEVYLGRESPMAWLLLVGALLIPTVWVFAKLGQRRGHEQMMHLISVLYHVLGAKGEVNRIE